MKAKLLLIYYGYISKKLINGVFLKSHADAFIDPKPDEHAELSWQLFNTKSSFLSPSRSSIPRKILFIPNFYVFNLDLEIKTFEGNQRCRLQIYEKSQKIKFQKTDLFLSHQATHFHLRSSGRIRCVEVRAHCRSDKARRGSISSMTNAIIIYQVGIIPTDTLPAVVCDMENNDAVRRLYLVKMMSPKKPLSLLCRGFTDIAKYTTGFPVSNEPGVPDTFSIVKKALPGPVR